MKTQTKQEKWNEAFRAASSNSFPNAGLMVSKVKPNHETARNIYQEDKAEITQAARNNGYRIILETASKVSFAKA